MELDTLHGQALQAMCGGGDEHALAGPAAEQLIPCVLQILRQGLDGGLTQRHQALFAALAHHLQPPFGEVQGTQRQGDELGGPQATAVEHLQDGGIAEACGRAPVRLAEQPLDLLEAEHPREGLGPTPAARRSVDESSAPEQARGRRQGSALARFRWGTIDMRGLGR
jgi:hypothetical protein